MTFDSLQPEQQAELATILQECPIPTQQFHVEDVRSPFSAFSDRIAAAVHVDNYRFAIGETVGRKNFYGAGPLATIGFSIEEIPGKDLGSDVHHGLTWAEVRAHFREWIERVHRQLSAPRWQDVLAQASTFSSPPDESADAGGPLEGEELELAEEKLDELEAKVAELLVRQGESAEATEAKLEELRAEIAALRAEARHQPKSRWVKSVSMHLGTSMIRWGISNVEWAPILEQLRGFADTLRALPPPT